LATYHAAPPQNAFNRHSDGSALSDAHIRKSPKSRRKACCALTRAAVFRLRFGVLHGCRPMEKPIAKRASAMILGVLYAGANSLGIVTRWRGHTRSERRLSSCRLALTRGGAAMLDPRRLRCNGLSRIAITTTRRGPQNENGRRLADALIRRPSDFMAICTRSVEAIRASAKGRRKNVCRVPARACPPGLPFFAVFRGVLANEKTMPFRGIALNAGFSCVQHDSRRIRPPLSEGRKGVGLPTCAGGYIAGFRARA
jgi:hypothetical protein